MKTIKIKYNVNDEVWIYLAGEITKVVVKRITYEESTEHRPILLYNVVEVDNEETEWVWREETIFQKKEELQKALNENRTITLQ